MFIESKFNAKILSNYFLENIEIGSVWNGITNLISQSGRLQRLKDVTDLQQ